MLIPYSHFTQLAATPFLLSHSYLVTPSHLPPTHLVPTSHFSNSAHALHKSTLMPHTSTLTAQPLPPLYHSLLISQLIQSHGLHLTHFQAPLPKLTASHCRSKLSAPSVLGLTVVPNCHCRSVLYFSSVFFFLSIS